MLAQGESHSQPCTHTPNPRKTQPQTRPAPFLNIHLTTRLTFCLYSAGSLNSQPNLHSPDRPPPGPRGGRLCLRRPHWDGSWESPRPTPPAFLGEAKIQSGEEGLAKRPPAPRGRASLPAPGSSPALTACPSPDTRLLGSPLPSGRGHTADSRGGLRARWQPYSHWMTRALRSTTDTGGRPSRADPAASESPPPPPA